MSTNLIVHFIIESSPRIKPLSVTKVHARFSNVSSDKTSRLCSVQTFYCETVRVSRNFHCRLTQRAGLRSIGFACFVEIPVELFEHGRFQCDCERANLETSKIILGSNVVYLQSFPPAILILRRRAPRKPLVTRLRVLSVREDFN